MKNLENFKTRAKESGLSLMGLTGSSNGYPEPDLGWFVHGFDNFEQAKRFAEATGGEASHGEWRDGWGYAHYVGEAYKPYPEPTSDWYGDNYHIIYDELTMDDFFNHIGYKDEDDFMKYEDDAEKLAVMKEGFQKLIDDCNLYTDWNTQIAVLHHGEYLETIQKEPMAFSHDTKNEAIGVAYFFNED